MEPGTAALVVGGGTAFHTETSTLGGACFALAVILFGIALALLWRAPFTAPRRKRR